MNQDILDFIKSQRVGVLAVEMPDGAPHAATVHFAHSEDPLIFYFETDRGSRKAQAIQGKETARATFVIGADENNMRTLQMDGQARTVAESDAASYDKIYFGKFPQKKAKYSDPAKSLAFCFIPAWWRFTDWTGPQGKRILSSEDND